MFFSKNKHVLILIVFTIVAYIPIISGVVSLTNDARMVTYPIFYYFSDQLSKGYIPWWHYNMNLGFPLHADPGTPFWNPLFWLFALLGKSYYVFTLFVWIHIPIAVIGTFKLCRWLSISKNVSITLAALYVCSGFYATHLQHPNNLLEAAFLPYVLLYFLKILCTKNFVDSFYLAISLFLFVNSGYPGFPISLFYFLLIIFLVCLITDIQLQKIQNIKRVVILFSNSLLFAIILCLPYIISIDEILNNFYQAKQNVTSDFIANGGITIRSLISIMWPLASMVHKEFYQTDIAWNNMYVGVTILSFFIFSILYIKHKLKYPILFSGLFLLLLSFQGNIKWLLYAHLPGMSLIRSNGEFRIYFMLSVILLSGWAIDEVLKNKNKRSYKKILLGLICVCSFSLLISGWVIFKNQNFSQKNFTSVIDFFKSLSIADAVFIAAFISLILLLTNLFFIRSGKFILSVIIVDVLFNFWICTPYGGIELINESEVNKSIQQNIQSLNSLPANSAVNTVVNSFAKTKFIKEPSLFSNNISVDNGNAYPSMFTNYFNFTKKEYAKSLYTKRGIHFKNSDTNTVSNLSLSASSFIFDITNSASDTIVILQNYSFNWQAFVDNKKTKILQSSDGFILIPVTAGKHHVELKYYPLFPIITFFFSLIGWIIIGIILKRRNNLIADFTTSN